MVDGFGGHLSVPADLRNALNSAKALHETARRFNDRASEIKRLRDELESLTSTLASLIDLIEVETSILSSLGGFFRRCSQGCQKIEESMEAFYQMPPMGSRGFRDWRKMIFMGGGINDLMDTISEYNSIGLVILCIVKMYTSKVSQRVLEGYDELTMGTTHNLEIHLQRTEKTLALSTSDNERFDLEVERDAIKHCLRICGYAGSCIEFSMDRDLPKLEGVTGSESVLKQDTKPVSDICLGEVIACNGSQQTLVATGVGYFEIKKAACQKSSRQLIGSMTEKTLKNLYQP